MVDAQRFERLFEDIERRKRQVGESASAFPTREEYLEKDTEERLGAAKEILAKYAGGDKWTGATIDPEDEEHPGITVEALVGYRSEDPIREPVTANGRTTYRTARVIPERMLVQVYAHDTESGYNSDTMGLGQFREGPYTDEEGEAQEGWHVFRLRRRRTDEGDTLTLESKLAKDMIELVDGAVLELIDGVISDQRRFIGGQAVEGASEQPAPLEP